MDLSLLPVRVDTWGPFVFANADNAALPLARYFGGLPEAISRHGLELKLFQLRQREELQAEWNRKVLIENYPECYHSPVTHPGFSSVVDVNPDACSLQAFEWSSCQCAAVRVGVRGSATAYDARSPVAQGQYYDLRPSFTLSSHPGHRTLSCTSGFGTAPTALSVGRDAPSGQTCRRSSSSGRLPSAVMSVPKNSSWPHVFNRDSGPAGPCEVACYQERAVGDPLSEAGSEGVNGS